MQEGAGWSGRESERERERERERRDIYTHLFSMARVLKGEYANAGNFYKNIYEKRHTDKWLREGEKEGRKSYRHTNTRGHTNVGTLEHTHTHQSVL